LAESKILKFPSEEETNVKRFLMFSPYLFAGDGTEQSTGKKIVFFMPNSFKFDYNVNYEESSMGAFASSGVTDLKNLSDNASKFLTKTREGLFGAGVEFLGAEKSLAEKARGKVVNENLEMAFKSVSLREFSYTFNCFPKSKKDSDTLRDIIKELRIRMYPDSSEEGILKYPDYFVIDFESGETGEDYYNPLVKGGNKGDEKTFSKNCFLTSMSVEYNNNNKASEFKDTHAPTNITIDLSFKEDTILTRKDFE